jgi:hypothetical protein
MRRDKILLGAALRRSFAQKWQVSIYAAELILATGYSPEGMEILAIFARLDRERRAACKAKKVSA